MLFTSQMVAHVAFKVGSSTEQLHVLDPDGKEIALSVANSDACRPGAQNGVKRTACPEWDSNPHALSDSGF